MVGRNKTWLSISQRQHQWGALNTHVLIHFYLYKLTKIGFISEKQEDTAICLWITLISALYKV